MKSTQLNDAIEFLQSNGAQDIKPHHGGKHIKVRFLFKEQNLSLVVSVSPSDWRAGKNQKAFMKRMLREATARHEARRKKA